MVKQILHTILLCAVCYALAFVFVTSSWPYLSPLTANWPIWLPAALSTSTGFFLFYVITHMERGQLNPQGYMFMFLYGLACLVFGLTALHPTQYNTGMATLQVAFVIMLSWKAGQKYWTAALVRERSLVDPLEDHIAHPTYMPESLRAGRVGVDTDPLEGFDDEYDPDAHGHALRGRRD